MEISVEISFYPLLEAYEPPIQRFIQAVRDSGLRWLETPLSTMVFGEYDAVMQFLQREVRHSLAEIPDGVFSLKVVSGNRGDYAADF